MNGERSYRAYLLDKGGHIVLRVDIKCDDDETAKHKAKALVDDHDIELWDGPRKIALFKCPEQRQRDA